ncbi:MAG: hypothetical protein AAFV93_12045 [Chloroflexota bacterium]
MSTNAPNLDSGGGGDGGATFVDAERFMAEFNENAQIFRQLLTPTINTLSLVLPIVFQNTGRIAFLSSRLMRLRGQVNGLEGRMNELEAMQEECAGSGIHDLEDLPGVLAGDLVVTDDGNLQDVDSGVIVTQ